MAREMEPELAPQKEQLLLVGGPHNLHEGRDNPRVARNLLVRAHHQDGGLQAGAQDKHHQARRLLNTELSLPCPAARGSTRLSKPRVARLVGGGQPMRLRRLTRIVETDRRE